ncbi:MAG: hypothetical protein E6J74_39215 [Deltaproteobacteria bacterium]|nr:MAG: hypothetical protein E6J74_39215 [Deltaproteobacteria bacterium]
MADQNESQGANGLVASAAEALDAPSSTRNAAKELRTLRSRGGQRVKKPTRLERTRKLHEVLLNLAQELKSNGFFSVLSPPGPITIIGPEIEDPKTQGKIGHVREPLGIYIQRLSVEDNFFQRPPFDHLTDPIYRRLIRDFIEGAAMPESKVAALSWAGGVCSLRRALSGRLHPYDTGRDVDNIRFSIIDGLQRLYCFLIAVLLVWRREHLVQNGMIPEEAWHFFAESVKRLGDPEIATGNLLRRTIRYELFYAISLAGLLHYMVTFNSSQRRMSLRVQLEIMKKPLIEHLKSEGIPIWEDIGRMPGQTRPKDKFLASDIVLATQAFITHNSHVTTAVETDRFLDENQPYLDNIGDISDIMRTLKRINGEVHARMVQVYQSNSTQRFLMTNGDPFLLGFVAACGYVRNRGSMEILDKALDKLLGEFDRVCDDPLRLEAFKGALEMVNASRGKDARRLVDDTFRRFFLGVTTELDWLDTASQMTGGLSH